jgi:tetratricopeptide (TPR) repeat protein
MMIFAESGQQRKQNRVILSLAAVALVLVWSSPAAAFDFGGGGSRNTKKCPSGTAWSDKQGKCAALKSGSLSDDELRQAGRQLARDGHFQDAITVLDMVSDKNDAMVLTYLGYSHRKLGDVDLGIALYQKALDIDPENIDTREYLGEGYVSKGQLDLAWLELAEIEKRCGTRCDEYQALDKAMRSSNPQY